MTGPADRREQAAATAAALYAASRTSVDPTALTGQILTNAAMVTAASSAETYRMIVNLWRVTNPYDDTQVTAFIAKAGQLITAAQKGVAASTTAAQVMQLRALGINPDVSVRIPDNVRGATVKFLPDAVVVKQKPVATVVYQPSPEEIRTQVVDAADSEPARLFSRAVVTFRYQRSTGAEPTVANGAAEERIGSLIDANLMLAQRLAEQETLRQAQAQDSRVIGYRRVIHPELSKGGVCGLCVAASDRIYKIETLKAIHFDCKCGVVAVTRAHDPGFHLNKGDLGRLYNEAGEKLGSAATAAKHLKRTRYDIVHHSELGPVLTRVQGEKVPYYSIVPPAQAA